MPNSELTHLIESKFAETNQNIASLQTALRDDVTTINTKLDSHHSRIEKIEDELRTTVNNTTLEEIQLQLEQLKQDRLRNNLRLTGLPPIAFDDPVETIMRIDSLLEIGLLPSDFSVYADRNKSSLIVSFGNYAHKRIVINQLQHRKSLLAEELFPAISSNSNIYANDQLTPYFAKLFQAAWQAKKMASSHRHRVLVAA